MSDHLCGGKALKTGRECADQKIDNTFCLKAELQGVVCQCHGNQPW